MVTAAIVGFISGVAVRVSVITAKERLASVLLASTIQQATRNLLVIAPS